MTLLLVALPGNEALTARLAVTQGADVAQAEFRRFPDEETYLRVLTPVSNRSTAIVCTLDRPDGKFLSLAFAAMTLREFGAKQVGLIAPYLAYMRQDRRFLSGEAVTSAAFAKLMSGLVDWLVTIDPHLHRISSLSSIYNIRTQNAHAAPLLAQWIKGTVENPVLVGPDSESRQWVSEVAAGANAPFTILEKTRISDTEVHSSIPDVERWRTHTPVLVDDIISTGRTMIETLLHLRLARMRSAVCVGIHAVFAPGAYEAILDAGCSRIVTTNSIAHKTNAIDITKLVSTAVSAMAADDKGRC